MRLKVSGLNSNENIKEYKAVLKNFRNYSIYYSYEYLAYYENDSQKLNYFLLEENNKAIILMPFFLRKISSNLEIDKEYYDVITQYGYGGPLFDDIFEKYLIFFWKKVDLWYHENNIVSEFIRFNLRGNYSYYTGELVHTLINVRGEILRDQVKQWQNFIPKVRNNYRTAEKNGLIFVFKFGSKILKEDIKKFHLIYIETMNRNNADESYFFSLAYFESLILENFQNVAIVFSKKDDVMISTELIIYCQDTVYAFLGGTREDYFQFRPNDFLRVNIIKLASKLKLKYYVLGGGRTDGDGLYKSKKAFFPKDQDPVFYTGRKILNSIVYNQLTHERNSENTSFFPAYRL